MAELGASGPAGRMRKRPFLSSLLASSRFQAWAARFPLTRGRVRRDGAAMFDLVAGFCHSQILSALVQLRVLERLAQAPSGTDRIAAACAVPADRMQVLLQAGAALGLVKLRRGKWRVTVRGAALLGVPGLQGMITHHEVLYRDLADPVAFFRGETETELADFWPYVFGAGAAADPGRAASYSQLMSDSQGLVAADTLAAVRQGPTRRIMDVGGGTGAFMEAVGKAWPGVERMLFDLPAVVRPIEGVDVIGGSFRDDPLPTGADTISLIRILYDHTDETVAGLLRAVFEALPDGGRIIVSEPMSGGNAPEKAGDAYFALYCMAMQTGKARSAAQISAMLTDAGFSQVKVHRPARPYVTTAIEAVRTS